MTTHSVVRETVNRLDKTICIASLQWRCGVVASEEADQEYRNLNQAHVGPIRNEDNVGRAWKW
jgi:hypothetical protein